MQHPQSPYDIAIIGGGLAGLASSILLAAKGYAVVIFEKERYPYHKVCGEYISMESWNFLTSLGLPLAGMSLPRIELLELSAPNGRKLTAKLPLGGFGISRYKIDESLALIAKQNGVKVLEETKVQEILNNGDESTVLYDDKEGAKQMKARVCCGAFGKRSNLDIKWKRGFLQQKNSRINNYIGVKYHVKIDWPKHIIGLHNFQDGYCGISKIEDDAYCLCYLTTAKNLKKHNASIPQMEKQVLFRNPHLKRIFSDCEVLPGFPVTISQISFSAKSQVENGALLLGDAAGMITPLCGNGMSMALHSSKIAAGFIDDFLQSRCSRLEMENNYQIKWRKHFAARLQTGRILQRFFGNVRLSNLFINTFKLMPFLSQAVIKKTHGAPF